MEYGISQVAERFGIEPHTLRFYEKEGILSPARTKSGVRRYTDEDVSQLEFALCLKSTGMSLKDIRRYFELVKQGDETLEQRMEIFIRHKRHVLEEIETMQRYLEKIERKMAWLQDKSRGKL